MSPQVSDDVIVAKLNVLTRTMYLLLRTQGMTLRLIVDEAKELSPQAKKNLLEAIERIDKVIESAL